jgi:hypothetical protein
MQPLRQVPTARERVMLVLLAAFVAAVLLACASGAATL